MVCCRIKGLFWCLFKNLSIFVNIYIYNINNIKENELDVEDFKKEGTMEVRRDSHKSSSGICSKQKILLKTEMKVTVENDTHV